MDKNYSLEQLHEIAKEVVQHSRYKTILFNGEMGVGKTTLIKEICKVLGVQDNITSPTFSLVNEYKTLKETSIYHFDFYRIKNEEEALDIGIEDYFYGDNWCLIEWPDNIKNLLPLNTVKITITLHSDNNLRNIQLNHN